MGEDGWLKETILEMKEDIKELSSKFGDFMKDRRRTCPTAVEIEKAEKRKIKEDEIKARNKTIKWAIIGVAITLLIGIPAWLSFLGG